MVKYISSATHPQPPWPNRWSCDGCHTLFDIVDEQPEIVERDDKLDVTTIGDTKRVYLVNRYTELLCQSCR